MTSTTKFSDPCVHTYKATVGSPGHKVTMTLRLNFDERKVTGGDVSLTSKCSTGKERYNGISFTGRGLSKCGMVSFLTFAETIYGDKLLPAFEKLWSEAEVDAHLPTEPIYTGDM